MASMPLRPPPALRTDLSPAEESIARSVLYAALFDYPLTLRGIGSRERFRFMSRHFSVVLGFGCAFSLVFWLPCLGILMLPVGAAAATQLYWEIERAQ